jgi:hypothetical protein
VQTLLRRLKVVFGEVCERIARASLLPLGPKVSSGVAPMPRIDPYAFSLFDSFCETDPWILPQNHSPSRTIQRDVTNLKNFRARRVHAHD